MKKIIVISALLIWASILMAQQGAYLRVGGGYSISAANDVFTNTVLNQDSNFVYTLDQNIYGTIGSGAHFRLVGGYSFQQNFGMELEMEYLWGSRKYAGETTRADRNTVTYAYTRQLRIAPSFYVQASPGLLQPYAGFGLLIPLTGKTVLEEQLDNNLNSTYLVREVYGAFSLGFNGFVGVNVNYPNENFQLFFEIRHSNMRIKSKDALLVQWDETDKASGEVMDRLATANTFEKEIIFRDQLSPESNTITATVSSGVNFDFNQPLELLATKTNFNALSFNIGVKIRFAKRPEE